MCRSKVSSRFTSKLPNKWRVSHELLAGQLLICLRVSYGLLDVYRSSQKQIICESGLPTTSTIAYSVSTVGTKTCHEVGWFYLWVCSSFSLVGRGLLALYLAIQLIFEVRTGVYEMNCFGNSSLTNHVLILIFITLLGDWVF